MRDKSPPTIRRAFKYQHIKYFVKIYKFLINDDSIPIISIPEIWYDLKREGNI